ncbi:MAG TPA: S9 family peptidase [Lichenihabitans sp.]|jgi:oligopeptidase B|nr:S9 family peptidase [Lichenihabitans sp.]
MTDRTIPRLVTSIRPPTIPPRPHRATVHGVVLTDDFAWLRAANWREVLEDPAALPAEIRSVVEAENATVDAAMADTAVLQGRLVAEMRGRMEEEDADVPVPDGPFDYYDRFREGGQHELICRRPRGGGPEELLLDGDVLAGGKSFFELASTEHSPDHRLLGWSADDKGSELHTIRVRDIATGRDLDDALGHTDGAIVWTADGSAFFYVRMDENHRASSVHLHRLGTRQTQDRPVFQEPDPAWFVSIGRSLSGRFLIIDIHGHDAAEARVVDLSAPEDAPRVVASREPGLRYSVEHHGGSFVILTNADGAEDFKIVTAPLASPARAQWRDLVAHRPGRMIMGHIAFRDHLVRIEREDGLPRIVVRNFADGVETTVAFPEDAYALGLEEVAEQDTSVMRFSYSSMTTPTEIYDYDMASEARVLRKRQRVPSGHDPADYVTRRIFATAPDGAQVPVSILYRHDTPLDGSAPLLLYGYGAYGYALPASFGTKRLSLVDRGFVYALAHVRGGTDKGWAWYADGKLVNKPNTFTDFIAAGEALVEAGFTRRGRIVAQGGSAGGMLMGVVANDAPDLFAGIVADVPFVDVLNTILDKDLPLTPPEWLEWGDPITDAEAFARIRGYSPYDNVRPQRYPPILALGGLTDPRVTYWEPLKWVARLRATMTGGGPILLQTNMDAGHGGAPGRFDELDEVALIFAFALAVTARERT